MNVLILNICFLVLSSLAFAKKAEVPKGQKLNLISMVGHIELVGAKKRTKSVTNLDHALVEIKYPKSVLKFLAGYKSVNLTIDSDEFSFLVPGSSINKNEEFRVSKKYTGQNYNIELTKATKDFKSVVSEKNIECTYQTSDLEPQYSTDSDGNSVTDYVWVTNTHYGRQQAVVNDQAWLEKQLITIYDEQNQIRSETGYLEKQKMDVVKEITSCR